MCSERKLFKKRIKKKKGILTNQFAHLTSIQDQNHISPTMKGHYREMGTRNSNSQPSETRH